MYKTPPANTAELARQSFKRTYPPFAAQVFGGAAIANSIREQYRSPTSIEISVQGQSTLISLNAYYGFNAIAAVPCGALRVERSRVLYDRQSVH